MLKIALWLGAAVIVIGFFWTVYFVWNVFGGMIFIADRTESKVQESPAYIRLLNDVTVQEISKNEKPLPLTNPLGPGGTGNLPASVDMVMEPDGAIVKRSRVFDQDPGQSVKVLTVDNSIESPAESYVFIKNILYKFTDGKLGDMIGEYSGPALSHIGHVAYINKKYFLVNGQPASSGYSDSRLWQVDRRTLHNTEVATDAYYVFDRPPMVFREKGFNGVVVVYYTGDFSYAFGGDSSRPEFSIIRIYNDRYPEGKDIVKIGFKGGTIVDVKADNGSLILTGDPSRPMMAHQPRLPARIWKVTIPGVSK